MLKGAKMRGLTPILVKTGVDGAIKKPRQALTLAVDTYNCYILLHLLRFYYMCVENITIDNDINR